MLWCVVAAAQEFPAHPDSFGFPLLLFSSSPHTRRVLDETAHARAHKVHTQRSAEKSLGAHHGKRPFLRHTRVKAGERGAMRGKEIRQKARGGERSSATVAGCWQASLKPYPSPPPPRILARCSPRNFTRADSLPDSRFLRFSRRSPLP